MAKVWREIHDVLLLVALSIRAMMFLPKMQQCHGKKNPLGLIQIKFTSMVLFSRPVFSDTLIATF